MDPEYCTVPTPVSKLHLPDQSKNVGEQTPNVTSQFKAMRERYGDMVETPDSMRPTPFRRAVPGKDNN